MLTICLWTNSTLKAKLRVSTCPHSHCLISSVQVHRPDITNIVPIIFDSAVHVSFPLMSSDPFVKLKMSLLLTEKTVKKGKKDKKGKKSVST